MKIRKKHQLGDYYLIQYQLLGDNIIGIVRKTLALRSSMQSLLLKSYRPNTLYYGERSFAFAAPKLWNSIPEHIKSASSLTTFKTALKTYLFRRHFRDE